MARLLVIDDDLLVLQAIALTLEGDNLQVDTAGTGMDGIAAFTARRPDVVLCDVRLPDLSGLELLARLKEIDPKVPVVPPLVLNG
ncbi:MAG: response regulator [Gemmataceae bacterium]